MPLDGVSSRILGQELTYELSDSRVDRIYQPDRFSLLLYFRNRRGIRQLSLSANPSSPRLFLTTRRGENPRQAPSFCMMLRKYLLGACLLRVNTADYERVFEFEFVARNELGDPEPKYLIAELMGRHSNLILLNRDRMIHDSLIHVDAEISRVREVMPARPYLKPPSQNKQSPDHWLAFRPEILPFLDPSAEISQRSTAQLERVFLQQVAGFSPLLCRSIVTMSGLDERMHVDQLTREQAQILSDAFYRLAERIQAQADQPTLYFQSEHDQVPSDFHAYELKTSPYRQKTASLSVAMDIYYGELDRRQRFQQSEQRLARGLSQAMKHLQRKLDIHQRDYEDGLKAEKYKRYGELLTAQLYRFKDQVSDHVTVIDYYDPEQAEVEIPLSPFMSVKANAANYFKLYRKAIVKLEQAERWLKRDQAEADWLYSLQVALDRAEKPEDLEAIWVEFQLLDEKSESAPKDAAQPPQHILRNRLNPGKPSGRKKRYKAAPKRQKQTRKPAALPPRRYRTTENLIVLAGRNNIQNDLLSLRQAKAEDYWFHVRNMTGTHVILQRSGKQEPGTESIEQAAQIAAWYSEANKQQIGKGKVPVDYCPAKYVRKPKGARPGMVIYDHQNTVWVEPKLLPPDRMSEQTEEE